MLTTTGYSSAPTYTPKPKESKANVLSLISATSPFATALAPILNSQVINRTIGQALADGFDCWGATWTPTRAEQEMPQWIEAIAQRFEQALNVPEEDLEMSLNDFFKNFWGEVFVTGTVLEDWLGWKYDSAEDCTKRGLTSLEKGIDQYVKEIEAFLPSVAKSIDAEIIVSRTTVTLYREGNTSKSYVKSIPQVKVVPSQKIWSGITGGNSGSVIPAFALLAVVAWKGGFFKSRKRRRR